MSLLRQKGIGGEIGVFDDFMTK